MNDDMQKGLAVLILVILIGIGFAFCDKKEEKNGSEPQETVPIQVFDETINFPKIR